MILLIQIHKVFIEKCLRREKYTLSLGLCNTPCKKSNILDVFGNN